MKTPTLLLTAGAVLVLTAVGYAQPVITNQPQILATALGTTAAFMVGARGTEPLAYQWQKNQSDLAGRTGAMLTLTNTQLSDQADYRVVVSDSSGSVTSAVARLYVMSFASRSTNVLLDSFDDNRLTGWTLYGAGGTLVESNQQFTARGYWPGQRTLSTYDTFSMGELSTSYRTVGQGQTVEWRVDLVRMDENATNAVKFLVGTTSGGYGFFKWRDFILIDKYTGGLARLYTLDAISIPNTNVVLAFALTRVGPNVILTGRVLDKENPDVVLYERSFVDTPGSDATLTTADVERISGMHLNFSPDPSAVPYTYAGGGMGLFQYTDGTAPPATVTYDNFELRTYRVPVARYVDIASANPTAPYTNWATAARIIQDAVDVASAGDEIVVTNGLYASGGRTVGTNLLVNRVAVDKPLTLRSVNGPEVTIIQGYQVSGTTNGDGAIRCVYLTNGASLSGFTLTNGATRSDGDYSFDQSGGGAWCESVNASVSDCIVVGNSASWDGGGVAGGTVNYCTLTGNSAFIGGGAAGGTLDHCALLGNSATAGGGAARSILSRCALTGNAASNGGGAAGGLWGGGTCILNHCMLSRNSAQNAGGGAADSTLNNCTLTGNESQSRGGGAAGGWLSNCTVTGNRAANGGGISLGCLGSGFALSNCVVYFNNAADAANCAQFSQGALDHCCTTPLHTNGVGNITNAPLFVDYAGGDLRLQSNSPCINAGLNGYATGTTDLDGNPRLVSGTVDIGAYEFQGPGSMISYAWLQQFGLPTVGSADTTDADGDGHNVWQEWRTGTCPTNALSALRLLSAWPSGSDVTVSWQSVAGVSYFLERSTDLTATPPFTLLAPNISGQPGTTIYTDTNAASLVPLFYRIGVGQ